MLNRRDVIYLYDGSFMGFLSAVYDCNSEHTYPYDFEVTENGQQTLIRQYRHCIHSDKKAQLVASSVVNHAGKTAFEHLYCAFLAQPENKEMTLFEFIRLCMKHGAGIVHMLQLDCPNRVISASRSATNEAHMYRQFIRFGELENGVYYAQIEPKNDVLPLIADHFARRYASMPFIIHDSVHGQCIVYNGKELQIVDASSMPAVHFSERELACRKLWKQFYDSIEIKERHNEKCRMAHMPKRFWKFLTEL